MRSFIFVLSLLLTPALANEACFKAPTPLCVSDLAFEAAQKEPEGYALREVYETLIQFDTDLARREDWLKKYEDYAKLSKNTEALERLPVIKAEHLARIKKFDEAYAVLATQKNDASDPQILILDEARAGRIKEALARVEKIEASAQDALRQELMLIALKTDVHLAETIQKSLKEGLSKRASQVLFWGIKGDLKAFIAAQNEWVKGVKPALEYPYDSKKNLIRETYDTYFQGAILAKNKNAFNEALAARGAFSTSEETESVAKILRPLLNEGLADWVRLVSVHIALPVGEVISSEEETLSLKALSPEKLKELLEATQKITPIREQVQDLVIDALVSQGQNAEGLKIFNASRLAAFNKGNYDENTATGIFETLALWFNVKDAENYAAFKKSITLKEGKDFLTKLEVQAQKLAQLETNILTPEPNEEEWSALVEMLLLAGKNEKTTLAISRIQDHALRAAAFTQLLRAMFEAK